MVKRRKTKLEKWLSFNQHKKRFGAEALQQALEHIDYQNLKTTLVSAGTLRYTHGSDKDLDTHITALKDEFSGQPELLYYHAKLIVLIRREANIKTNIPLFEQLWDNEANFLLQHLNTRWLISASDTFADHSQSIESSAENKAYAMACSCLINTLKMHESERYLQKIENAKDDPQRYKQLTQERVALFNGVSAFAVGTDDTLRNMRWRLDACDSDTHSYHILKTLFARVQEKDTVYKRFRDRHTRKKTAWWS